MTEDSPDLGTVSAFYRTIRIDLLVLDALNKSTSRPTRGHEHLDEVIKDFADLTPSPLAKRYPMFYRYGCLIAHIYVVFRKQRDEALNLSRRYRAAKSLDFADKNKKYTYMLYTLII